MILDFFEKKENKVIVFYTDAKDSLMPQVNYLTVQSTFHVAHPAFLSYLSFEI